MTNTTTENLANKTLSDINEDDIKLLCGIFNFEFPIKSEYSLEEYLLSHYYNISDYYDLLNGDDDTFIQDLLFSKEILLKDFNSSLSLLSINSQELLSKRITRAEIMAAYKKFNAFYGKVENYPKDVIIFSHLLLQIILSKSISK